MTTKQAPVGAQTNAPSPVAGEGWGGVQIDINLIDPNPHQPRQEFDEAQLQELAGSIKKHGLIQPVVVEMVLPSPNGRGAGGEGQARYILHDGERRLRAAKLAGLAAIPANIVQPGANAQTLLVRAVVANVQRADLTPMEFARACQELADLGLSDADIGEEFNKSRSTVTNARRLLALPGDVQQQVEKGELSERQAMALLPLYQLPAPVRQAITDNTWDGKKLLTPAELTSDEIRNHARNAIRTWGQPLQFVSPDEEFSGQGVRSPTCAACELYQASGKNKFCLDRDCLAIKQNQVIAAYLAKASQASGRPALDPAKEYGYDNTDGFYGNYGSPALEHALKENCPNLHLTYNRREWDSGYSPKGFDKCRYICLHNGQGCACRQAIKGDEDSKVQQNKQAAQQLRDRAINHLAQLIQSNHPAILRAILYTTVDNWRGAEKKAVLDMPPNKIHHRLADWLLSRNANPSDYFSPEKNQVHVNDWLLKMQFPALDIGGNLVAVLSARLEKLAGWLKDLINTLPAPEQVDGNLTNLAKIAEAVRQLHQVGSAADREQLDKLDILPTLDRLKAVLLEVKDKHSSLVEIKHVSWLLTVPATDINFKSRLADVQYLATLDYALALAPLYDLSKTAREAIERRRRQIAKQTLPSGETR